MLKHLLTQRATILDESDDTEDRYGDDIRGFTDTTGELWKCRIDPMKEQEYEVDRDTRRSWFRLFLTEYAVGHIDSKSRVIVDGITYEVFGEPKVYRRRARVSHIECVLRIIEG